MLKIESGLEKRPLKVVIYGAEGIGKSTFASQFPEPLFLDTEGGTSSLTSDVLNAVAAGSIYLAALKRSSKIQASARP